TERTERERTKVRLKAAPAAARESTRRGSTRRTGVGMPARRRASPRLRRQLRSSPSPAEGRRPPCNLFRRLRRRRHHQQEDYGSLRPRRCERSERKPGRMSRAAAGAALPRTCLVHPGRVKQGRVKEVRAATAGRGRGGKREWGGQRGRGWRGE